MEIAEPAGVAAREVLRAGASGLVGEDGLEIRLRTLLDAIARPLGIASAAIVVRDGAGSGLQVVAGSGLDEAATAGLTEAMKRPTHPVTMTFEASAPTYDVFADQPGWAGASEPSAAGRDPRRNGPRPRRSGSRPRLTDRSRSEVRDRGRGRSRGGDDRSRPPLS